MSYSQESRKPASSAARFSHCLETDVALARLHAQRERRLWWRTLRILEERRAAYATIDAVRCWWAQAKYQCRLLRQEQRA